MADTIDEVIRKQLNKFVKGPQEPETQKPLTKTEIRLAIRKLRKNHEDNPTLLDEALKGLAIVMLDNKEFYVIDKDLYKLTIQLAYFYDRFDRE